ncbi:MULTISPECIES: hypothetical protein [Micromonosporaceae]|uniref:hypothetical protein n=1 Tax=Micromonosporaceae TaxID=28056 RepID=UPI00248ADF57|nr:MULTISPECIES: hypothetical protein [unclassified Solwaraspora]WBB98135.1 hypothetical protein O7553_04050 [Solwaraspora sp. WMMA2059]WBC23310.1 hypothetical protein O7543_13310 [Solwaraspora sp. WMMA2080]
MVVDDVLARIGDWDVDEFGRAGRGAPSGSRYADQRPYVVSENLDDLHGPVSGQVTLSRSLDWSGRAQYDLANPRRLASMYETVLREATTVDDLIQWLDGPTLVRIWPTLVLPPQVRQVWESKHQVLAHARQAAA